MPGVTESAAAAAGSRTASAASSAVATQVLSGFCFTPVADPAGLRDVLETRARTEGLLGTVLIAAEGVNLSLLGEAAALDRFEALLRQDAGFARFAGRRSASFGRQAFRRLKVRCRREIVTLGRAEEPLRHAGARRVDPAAWHALLDDPRVTVIDVRNRYEVAAGSFPGSVDPGTDGFREFPAWVEANLDPAAGDTIAMFCTGGIRCEKAAAWMRGRGFADVRELDGGVLAYLDAIAPEQSRWEGDCFVFDDRVSLREGLVRGELETCHGCRRPLTPQDRASNAFEAGVSCPGCIDTASAEVLAGRRERRRQVELGREQGREHLAPIPAAAAPAATIDAVPRGHAASGDRS